MRCEGARNKDDKLLCATIMDPTPAELGRQKRSHSESAAPRRSIFRDLLTPTDSETRYEATLTTLAVHVSFPSGACCHLRLLLRDTVYCSQTFSNLALNQAKYYCCSI